MKKIVCGDTRCFFDTYEPVLIYDSSDEGAESMTGGIDNEYSLSVDISDMVYLEFFYDVLSSDSKKVYLTSDLSLVDLVYIRSSKNMGASQRTDIYSCPVWINKESSVLQFRLSYHTSITDNAHPTVISRATAGEALTTITKIVGWK